MYGWRLMTQEFTASGQAKTTFTFTPTDLPRQLQNRLLGRLAGVGADTTLADIFGVDYNARGQLVARDGAAIDVPALLQEMLGVIAEFGGDQLKSLTDPAKWLDSLKAGLDLGTDALGDFARTHGLQEAAPEDALPIGRERRVDTGLTGEVRDGGGQPMNRALAAKHGGVTYQHLSGNSHG